MHTTDPDEQYEILKDWLAHPGTKIVGRALHTLAKKRLLDYDQAIIDGDLDRARDIAAYRRVVTQDLPDIVSLIMNRREGNRRAWEWKFWQWFRVKVLGRRPVIKPEEGEF
jgi:hypothetical protein